MTLRIALPKRLWKGRPKPGDHLAFLVDGVGIVVNDEILHAELHHTKHRPIRRTELVQGDWQAYRGSYWLLTVQAA